MLINYYDGTLALSNYLHFLTPFTFLKGQFDNRYTAIGMAAPLATYTAIYYAREYGLSAQYRISITE